MVEMSVSRRTLWRAGVLAVLMVGLALAVRVPVQAQACDDDKLFDPVRGTCVDPAQIDCGPNPYKFNDIGGHWERLFYDVCWFVNDDAFEKIFHGKDFGAVQAELAALGLAGLSHDEQVNALLNQGALGGPSGLIPEVVCEDGYEYNPWSGACEKDPAPDCGPNPYNFNHISLDWERDFNKWCFGVNRDPFEVLFHKQDFWEAQQDLASVGLGGLTHDEALFGLERLGYWNVAGAFVPDGAPTFPR